MKTEYAIMIKLNGKIVQTFCRTFDKSVRDSAYDRKLKGDSEDGTYIKCDVEVTDWKVRMEDSVMKTNNKDDDDDAEMITEGQERLVYVCFVIGIILVLDTVFKFIG